MSDLINREEAIDALERRLAEPSYQHNGEDWYFGMNSAIFELYDLPPADKPTGEWIKSEFQNEEDVQNDNYLYNCSECGHGDVHARTQEVPYCWWCGCRMKGGDDE